MIMLAATRSLTSAFQLIGVLLIFVFVLVITWLTTRFIAGYQKVQTQGKNLKLVETLRISNNKFLQIVKAGEQYLVLAVGKDEVHLLTTLSEEELIKESAEIKAAGSGSFRGALTEALGRMKDQFPKKP